MVYSPELYNYEYFNINDEYLLNGIIDFQDNVSFDNLYISTDSHQNKGLNSVILSDYLVNNDSDDDSVDDDFIDNYLVDNDFIDDYLSDVYSLILEFGNGSNNI